ncbi:uncharacterized protein LOC135206253 [Macrobrachium nipponense]|uniref:uncharacterized protein LOC135206253 n=1 Tax=Macrobrachium nipponense TaxID=159736 RepID=UPI0030C7CAA6
MNPCAFFILVIPLIGVVRSVTIVRLTVPEVVQTNSTAVVLDCDYEVEEWERLGLVLKWYIDGVHLVYQWIPPGVPQAAGVLNGRVNTTFRASSEPWEAHRAIYIPYPDSTLSGRYSCTVSTFEDEDTSSAPMLVWTPAKHVDLKYWRPSEHLVNITCFASAVAPKPAFTLYTQAPDGNRTEVTVRGGSESQKDGLYWAGAWGLIVWADTPPESVIGCTMRLPGTPHVHTRNKVYHPDLPIITTTTTTTTTTQPTTTEANRHPRPASDMSQSVPNATNKFFDFSGLFGSASEGNAVRASAIFHFSLMWFACALSMLSAYL